MRAALAVICGLFVEAAVVVVEDQVFALITDDVGDTRQIAIVLSDDESRGIKCHYHSSRKDVTTLIVIAAGILSRGQRDVRRILPMTVGSPICLRNENRVIVEAKMIVVS